MSDLSKSLHMDDSEDQNHISIQNVQGGREDNRRLARDSADKN